MPDAVYGFHTDGAGHAGMFGPATGDRVRLGDTDLVITNALIVDHTGIYKADIGVRDGLICGIGKAGNPGLQDGVDPALVVGPGTEALAGEGMICTAGAIDSHIHFICPQLVTTALTSGVTTLLGRRHTRSGHSAAAPSTPSIPKGPAAGTRPTSCASAGRPTCCPAPPIPRVPSRSTQWPSIATC